MTIQKRATYKEDFLKENVDTSERLAWKEASKMVERGCFHLKIYYVGSAFPCSFPAHLRFRDFQAITELHLVV